MFNTHSFYLKKNNKNTWRIIFLFIFEQLKNKMKKYEKFSSIKSCKTHII